MKLIKSILFILFLASINLHAEKIYVKANVTGINNGSSWQNAYSDLQKAIQNANQGDEIWVAKGIYFPTDGTDKNISFKLKENLSLYGGFNGTETNLTQRNWTLNETILSGNIGNKSTNTDNSNHVVTTANQAKLDGFIVEDGYAMGGKEQSGQQSQDRNSQSSGMKRESSGQQGQNKTQQGQPQTHTTPQNITQSGGAGAGAGILNFKTSPTIRNTIVRNCSAGKGGGVYNMTSTTDKLNSDSPSPVFINVKIQGNHAFGRGGGMQNDMGTNPILINCEFTNNVCDSKGGALYNDFNCSPIIIGCLFENNKAHDAAAMGNDGSSCPIIIDTKIVNNVAESQGAGLYQGSYNANMRGKGNSPLVINSIIKDNTSTTNGLPNTMLWGEDWIYSWNSEIEGYNHSMTTLDDKYNGLIKISEETKTLDAESIDKKYKDKIKAYLNINLAKSNDKSGHGGFGTDNLLAKTASIPSNRVYVKSGSINGDGTSWKSAFSDLQDALTQAEKMGGAEIWVASGTYKPTSGQDRSASFILKNGIGIYGGFIGNEKNSSERNFDTNKTILSGNIGDVNSATDNSYHVILGSLNSIIDGISISDGYADGVITDRFGGGLYNWGYESSCIVKNTTFKNNYAEDGGAVFCFGDVLSYFENVHFENNTALIAGAASFRFGASCELNNCSFNNNTANARGGAITINYGSNVVINHSEFNQNKTQGNGGAIWVDDQASQYGGTKPVITDCIFKNNQAGFYGGAIHNYNIATSVIQQCSFTDNNAKYGKDIANTLRSQVTISNNQNPQPDIYSDESSRVSESAVEKMDNKKPDRQNLSADSKTLDNIDFSVTIIGSGSPQYNPERTQASALVQYNGIRFLVDMGNGTVDHLNELGLTGKNSPDALLLTHHHIDHNAELIPMLQSKLMLDTEFLVAGPSPIDEMLAYTKKFYREDINYRMSGRGRTFDGTNTKETVKVLTGGESFEYKGVKISTLEVPHSIKTIAYRFDVDGKSIVITGDLTYTSQLQKFAKDVDILVIDGKTAPMNSGNRASSTGTSKATQQKSGSGSNSAHSSIEDIAKMAAESNAKTMVLTHLGTQAFDTEATTKRYAELGFKGKVVIAADLLTITPEGENFMTKTTNTSASNGQQANRNANSQKSTSTNTQNKNGNEASSQRGNPMERFDSNKDNKISESEAKGLFKENFSKLDLNKDGYITMDELPSGGQKR